MSARDADDLTEEQVAEVRVARSCSDGTPDAQVVVEDAVDELLRWGGSCRADPSQWERVREAGGVVQKMSDPWRGRASWGGQRREVASDRFVEVEPSLVGEANHGGGGDDLRQREPQVRRLGRGGPATPDVGEPCSAGMADPAAVRDRDRQAGDLSALPERLDDAADGLVEVVPGGRMGVGGRHDGTPRRRGRGGCCGGGAAARCFAVRTKAM